MCDEQVGHAMVRLPTGYALSVCLMSRDRLIDLTPLVRERLVWLVFCDLCGGIMGQLFASPAGWQRDQVMIHGSQKMGERFEGV